MRNRRELSLYVHIPFCIRKCNYCDFLSFAGKKEEQEQYQKALCQEIESFSLEQKEEETAFYSVSTIFFGGGTPSILAEKQIEQILNSIRKSFVVERNAEITIEMNPGTITKEKLKVYQQMGINRLSIGLQTTDNKKLKQLGRIHTYEQFLENYGWARELGFNNISVDLMSALPDESLAQYQRDLERILALKPEHISSYSLILEEGTPFSSDPLVKEQLPDEEEDRAMYKLTGTMLKNQGYERYEISNYAQHGKQSHHNNGYWTGREYLGLGLGASSYLRSDSPFLYGRTSGEYGARFANTDQFLTYLQKPCIPCGVRSDFIGISKQDAMEEFMFLGLRMRKGVCAEEFYQKFGIELFDVYKEVLNKFVSMGFLQWKQEKGKVRLSLTERGIDISNSILCEFLLD